MEALKSYLRSQLDITPRCIASTSCNDHVDTTFGDNRSFSRIRRVCVCHTVETPLACASDLVLESNLQTARVSRSRDSWNLGLGKLDPQPAAQKRAGGGGDICCISIAVKLHRASLYNIQPMQHPSVRPRTIR